MSSKVAETNADMQDMVATVDVEATWADPKTNHHTESENGQEGVHENILQVNTLVRLLTMVSKGYGY
eukprot:scaffold421178_cov63-Attheya_sp.AAC.1